MSKREIIHEDHFEDYMEKYHKGILKIIISKKHLEVYIRRMLNWEDGYSLWSSSTIYRLQIVKYFEEKKERKYEYRNK